MLVVGLSFVPAVSARVPAMKKVAVTTRTELLRAEQLLARWVPWFKSATQTPRRTSTSPTAPKAAPAKKPAATAQKSAPARPAAVQTVTVKSTPIGVTVQLNARAVGRTPLTLKLAPGTYKVTFSRPGYLSVTRTITVKAGQAASLNVTLAKSSSAPAPAPVTAPQPPPPIGGEGK
ncbi:MAG TPA: PEGA domain-containing protein [bacterium]|nr:PEGA domain-containing protein [bacterium]